jgi:hypothetical protein
MNKVTVEPIVRTANVQPYSNKVEIEVIRIHTDYEFLYFYQTVPEHKEV